MLEISTNIIQASIREIYLVNFKQKMTRRERHNLFIQKICALAHQLGFQPEREYYLPPKVENERPRYIDIVWNDNRNPAIAFEIDSSLRVKSIGKLIASPPKLKFWVYYGSQNPEPFKKKLDTDNKITLIYIPPSERNTFREPQVSMSAVPNLLISKVENLLSAEQYIRQAIQACWEMLPKDKRSLENAKAELDRLIQRAFDNLQEDVQGEQYISPSNKRILSIREQHPKAYKPWTNEDDELLKQKYLERTPVQELAKHFQRQPGAIRSRLRKLSLIK
jgi:hypothetical protein